MSKLLLVSALFLIPMIGVGGLLGSAMNTYTEQPISAAMTMQPLEIHLTTDVSKLPDQEIESFY
jgi:hypothetical protein